MSGTALAGERAKEPARANVTVISVPTQECPADDLAFMSGLKAFIDPQTGELRAGTPEEEAALARAMGIRTLQVETAREVMIDRNGVMSIELGEDALQDFVVRLSPDGKPVFLCVPRSETVKAFTRPVSSPKAAEEK